MEIQHRLYIGGRFVPAEDGATMPSLNPHDNTPLADVSMAGKADIDKAVEAAHAAFPKWSRTAAAERGRLLLKLADKIEERADELARLETLDTGHPLRDTRALDAATLVLGAEVFERLAQDRVREKSDDGGGIDVLSLNVDPLAARLVERIALLPQRLDI